MDYYYYCATRINFNEKNDSITNQFALKDNSYRYNNIEDIGEIEKAIEVVPPPEDKLLKILFTKPANAEENPQDTDEIVFRSEWEIIDEDFDILSSEEATTLHNQWKAE